MVGIDYVRRDLVIRFARALDQQILVEFSDGERTNAFLVPRAARLMEQPPAAEVASLLLGRTEIRNGLALWLQARSAALQPVSFGAADKQRLERVCLRIDDDRLAALPMEDALHYALGQGGPGWPPIPRLVAVPPRVAQVPFTLPLRLLQLDKRDDFDLRHTVNNVFGTHAHGRNSTSVMRVKTASSRKFARWTLPSGWKTVDVLHLDRPATAAKDRMLAMSAPGEVGTLGWLARCVDLWRTRLVVIRGGGEAEMSLLRRFAHRLAAQGGPAVWLVDGDQPGLADRLRGFYNKLIHDAPVDLAVAIAMAQSLSHDAAHDTLIVGCGREDLVRVSAPGDHIAALTQELNDPDSSRRADSAGKLWSFIAGTRRDLHDTAAIFAKTVHTLGSIADGLPKLRFDIHEGDGVVPLGKSIGALRRAVHIAARPTMEIRAVIDQSGPRFVNPALSRLDVATGDTEPIPQPGARLQRGKPIVLGVQLGPRHSYAPVLDATALVEEPFKWSEGRQGVWLSVGVTGLDFMVTGVPIQEVWLPREGASDVVEFVVEPTRAGISQLRFCVYFGADLLQSHRLAALVIESQPDAGGSASKDLAEALGIPIERVGDAGWLARMEYAAAADLAAPPGNRDVALSIFANDLGGRRVFTSRGSEGYEVLIAGDTSQLADDIRSKLEAMSRDKFNLYAFRQRKGVPLHSGTPAQRDAALHGLAHVGWTLFDAIFEEADQITMATDLAGERRVIHVAHSLLENVIPWGAIYDRRYDVDRITDETGLPVLRAVCPAGIPDAAGQFPTTTCGTASNCPLSSQGRKAAAAAGQGVAEDAIVCARHFWGFRHVIELPPYQEEESTTQKEESASPATPAATAPAAPSRRGVTSAAKPANLLLGYNAALGTADDHRAELKAMLTGRKLDAVWQEEKNRDVFLTQLRRASADLVYLFCHARGGVADPTVKPPALELQETTAGQPVLIRASAFSGVQLTHHPLFFINGCNTAAFSPDALSPFIRKLVRDCEAAGAIGTEIPVFELLAAEVARLFLTRFLDGQMAGEALLDIRRELLARGNPLGLVYTLYAVAELTIVQ